LGVSVPVTGFKPSAVNKVIRKTFPYRILLKFIVLTFILGRFAWRRFGQVVVAVIVGSCKSFIIDDFVTAISSKGNSN
jgi:hypothetical protein